jgi:DNA (cytosine-5)-methyltransferase 1
MLRIIREIEPTWVVGENVRGLLNWTGPEGQPSMVFTEIIADMEAAGYQIWPYLLPAAGVNAPHQRQRIFFIARNAAHTHGTGKGSHPGSGTAKAEEVWWRKKGNVSAASGSDGNAAHTTGHGLQHRKKARSTEEGTGKVGQCAAEDTAAGSNDWTASHTHSPHAKYKVQTGRHITAGTFQPADAFTQFPSVHPICGGNDGLPFKLDGISFPKWRKESLKAYGNAVVPPLIFQIFSAIQDMEALLAEGRTEITFNEFKEWKEQ